MRLARMGAVAEPELAECSPGRAIGRRVALPAGDDLEDAREPGRDCCIRPRSRAQSGSDLFERLGLARDANRPQQEGRNVIGESDAREHFPAARPDAAAATERRRARAARSLAAAVVARLDVGLAAGRRCDRCRFAPRRAFRAWPRRAPAFCRRRLARHRVPCGDRSDGVSFVADRRCSAPDGAGTHSIGLPISFSIDWTYFALRRVSRSSAPRRCGRRGRCGRCGGRSPPNGSARRN